MISTALWGSQLGTQLNSPAEFFQLVAERTIVGQMLRVRRVPLLTRLIAVTSGSTAYWVQEGKSKPLSNPVFEASTLSPKKVVSVIVTSMELLQSGDPRSEAVLREDLVRALSQTVDEAFLDPSNPGDDATPASILDGALALPPSGPGDPTTDIETLLAHLGDDWLAPHFVMSSFAAAQVTSEKYPSIGFGGGEIAGIPAVTSPYVPAGLIGLLDAAAVAVGEGDAEVRIARDATIEMENQPSGDALVPTGTSQVSLWQANAVGLPGRKDDQLAAHEGRCGIHRGRVLGGQFGSNVNRAG